MSVRERLEAIVGAENVGVLSERGGAPELPLAVPRDDGEAALLVRLAGKDGLALVPVGLGSKAGWTRAPERADFALSTRGLAGVVAYEPGDGTVAARAGTTMAALAATVAEGGHRLTPDVPRPAEATVGGVVAAAQSGVDRLRVGPVRNHVLGVRALLADGTTARSGGRLVKNVTGYDLHRLYCGSSGTLCVVLEVALRLFAAQETERVVRGTTGSLGDALESLERARALPLPFDALAVSGTPGSWQVTAALSGRAATLDAHAGALDDALAGLEGRTELSGERARAARALLRDEESANGWPTLRVAMRPSALRRAAEHVLAALDEVGAARPRLLLHPGIATLDLWIEFSGGVPVEDACAELEGVVRRDGLFAHWRGATPGVDPFRGTAATEEEPPGAPLMRDLRRGLDPTGVFARGRFRGGL